MSNQPCPTVINECPCEVSPFKNLSSEAPDGPVFFRQVFARVIPPLGTAGGPQPCQVTCESPVSQQAADLCAAEQGFECSTGSWTSPVNGIVSPPPPAADPVPPPENYRGGKPFTLFFNVAQSCGADCPDGSVFTYSVPAGIFTGLNQAIADKQAFSYACRQAQLHMVCLGPLSVVQFACFDTPYLASITATGRFLAVAPQADIWTLISGQLPPGLNFNGGAVTGGTVTIDGTPTQLGTFTFTIQIVAPSGDTMSKQYTITIGGIPNAGAQPDGMVGTAYSQQLLDVGFVDPVFSLVTGVLPDGLSLSAGGLISGTPTTAQTTTATVQAAENGGVAACQAQVSITIQPQVGFKWNIPWVNLGNTSVGLGTASAMTGPASVVIDAASPGVFDRGSMDDFGEPAQSYTGPQTAANLHLVMSGAGSIGFTIAILQNGNPILQQSVVNAAGTFDFPFTVAAGVNSPVQVSFLEVYSAAGGSVHVAATLTPS